MKLILDDLSFERGNLENTCRDVQVHFYMEQLSQREVKFYLSVYAGYISDDDFRYQNQRCRSAHGFVGYFHSLSR